MRGVFTDDDKNDMKESFIDEHVGEEHRAFVCDVLGLEWAPYIKPL